MIWRKHDDFLDDDNDIFNFMTEKEYMTCQRLIVLTTILGIMGLLKLITH